MKCESCKQKEATVLLTKISADQKRAVHLCPSCAAQVAQSNSGESKPAAEVETAEETNPVAKSSNAVTGHLPKTGKASDKTCSRCGTTYRQFRKNGRFGCDSCYQAFSEELQRLMKRIHGAHIHVGKRPQAASAVVHDTPDVASDVPSNVPSGIVEDLAELRAELEKAVQDEAYEQAAALRDRIGQLEAAANDAPEDGR
jgi:protein arginine kinase activator